MPGSLLRALSKASKWSHPRCLHCQLMTPKALASSLVQRQLDLETTTLEQATAKYNKITESMVKLGKTSELSPVQRSMVGWYVPLCEAIDAEQRAITKGTKGQDRALYGLFLQMLPPDKHAVLTMHAVINTTAAAVDHAIPFSRVCKLIGENVQAEVNLGELQKRYGKGIVSRLTQGGALSTRRINQRARLSLENGDWSEDIKVKIGAVLVKLLIESVKTREGKPAFTHETTQVSFKNKTGYIIADKSVYEDLLPEGTLVKDAATGAIDTSALSSGGRNLPMLVEPKPWTTFDNGGFLRLKTKVMRTKGSRNQLEALRHAPMERVLQGLNSLGKLKWKINTRVLDVCQAAWDQSLEIADLPSRTDVGLPPELDPAAREEDPEKWREYNYRVRRAKQKNADLHSLRSDASLKLGIAQQFRDEEHMYFPYNMDFRGRAYPMPPNLNHLGSDMSRGVLEFGEKKALGPTGLFWLKVQLANLAGFDKASFRDRAAWTDSHMGQVYDSALRPLEGERWWSETCESPVQALAVCMELRDALESGDPSAFMSGQPVHMDGSCNGLQHYAALGRDKEGGKQVNLMNGAKPRDVYSGVCAIVIEKIALEASRDLGPHATEQEMRDHESAKLVNGLIDRKVVKQTVMTSVYGVTFIGARKQIQNRLEEKLASRGDGAADPEEMERLAYGAAYYVANIVMDALRELFTSARSIMDWLGTCARIVGMEGEAMNWVTPLGLPVCQPYRRGGIMTVKTVMQTVQVVQNNDDLRINVQRQRSAFPPNFVHSLDSTHMLLTAIRMERLGLSFTAVHDSYWTHACDVEAMNDSLRRCFVELYSEPILEDLHQQLSIRFPQATFPPIPERGSLDLDLVVDSAYFFN